MVDEEEARRADAGVRVGLGEGMENLAGGGAEEGGREGGREGAEGW